MLAYSWEHKHLPNLFAFLSTPSTLHIYFVQLYFDIFMSPRKTKAPTEDEVKSTPESSAQPSSESPRVPSSPSAPLKPQLPQILKDVDAYRDLKQLIRGCSSSLRSYEVEVIIAMIENHLTIAEAAQMCEVAESTIKKWLKRHEYAGLTDDQKVRRNMFDRWFWGGLPYINEEQWKSLKRQANNYLKTTHTGKECPWAYERDYSFKTQVARRGTEETPKVDYLMPYKAFKTALKQLTDYVDGIFFDPDTTDIPMEDLVLYEEDWCTRPYGRLVYIHRKTGLKHWTHLGIDVDARFR